MNSQRTTNNNTGKNIQILHALEIKADTVLNGTLLITNSFTIHSGAICTMHNTFIFADSAGILVKDGAGLRILGAHLYSKENKLWKGIRVENGGKVEMHAYRKKGNLIEDADTAIKVSDNTSSGNVLSITSTVFNKNYIAIALENCLNAVSSSYVIHSNVFTCRDFTFTPTQWPQASTSSPGLRYAATTTVLTPPYLLQGAPVVKLKNPYGDHYSETAIRLTDVGTTSGGTFNGMVIGSETVAANFNLFDAHGGFVSAVNSNVKMSNNVFQNTQRYYLPLNPGATLTAYYLAGGIAITTGVTGLMNTRIDLSSAAAATGNRFWDCHFGIGLSNVFQFEMSNALFRSTQTNTSVPLTPFTWFGINSQAPGQNAILSQTNRADLYRIENNEFSNVSTAIFIGHVPDTYTLGGFTFNGIHTGTLSVSHNTFSPGTSLTSTVFGTSFLNNAITVGSLLSHTVSAASGAILAIGNNHVHGAYRGISLSGLNGLTKSVHHNTITLTEDNLFNAWQRGVEITNTFGSSSNPVTTVIENNILSSIQGTANSKVSLVYSSMNAGPTSPRITCNTLTAGYRGFEFSGPNGGTYWRRNEMQNLARGMELNNAGVIGVQGGPTAPSDNKWNGSWGGISYGTWVEFGNNANNSPLYVKSGTPWNPPNNSGNAPTAFQYDAANGNLPSGAGSYTCGGGPNQIVIPIPDAEDYETAELFYIANKSLYNMLYHNPFLRTPDEYPELSDWFVSQSSSSMAMFAEIEEKLGLGQLAEARSLYEGIDAVDFNAVEINYTNFYKLYIKFKDETETFSTEDSTALVNLANHCPGTNGACVYKARVLLQIMSGQPFYSSENCEESSGARFTLPGEIKSPADAKWDVELFPNPNNGNFALVTKNEKEILEISINDITGKEIFKNQIQINKHYYVLDLQLIKGVYFVTIKNEANEIVTKKMAIVK